MKRPERNVFEHPRKTIALRSKEYDAWVVGIQEKRDSSKQNGLAWRIYDHLLYLLHDFVGMRTADIVPNPQSLLRVSSESFESYLDMLKRSRDMYDKDQPEQEYGNICGEAYNQLKAMVVEEDAIDMHCIAPQTDIEQLLELKLKHYRGGYRDAKDMQEFLAASFGIHVKLVATRKEMEAINSVFFGNTTTFPSLQGL